MNLKKISIFDIVYSIDKEDLVIEKNEITAIEFIPRFVRDKLSIKRSTLAITIYYCQSPIYFDLNSKKEIIDDNPDYFFDRQTAEEELIILKTGDSRAVFE